MLFAVGAASLGEIMQLDCVLHCAARVMITKRFGACSDTVCESCGCTPELAVVAVSVLRGCVMSCWL